VLCNDFLGTIAKKYSHYQLDLLLSTIEKIL